MNLPNYCGNCVYYDPDDRCSVGCRCKNPELEQRRRRYVSSYKAPSTKACKHFEHDPWKGYIPVRPGLPGFTPVEKAAYKAAETLKAYCHSHDECDGCMFKEETEMEFSCDLEGTEICGWDLKATLKRRIEK